MSVFSISDLHLSLSVPKPMDVFSSRWQGYTEKLEKRWRAVVTERDTVIIPGDVSWAMSLDEAEEDFRFIDSLPGKKLIGKGNHDYWWTTVSKMTAFLEDRGITSVSFLHNNAYVVEDRIVCGTKGWFPEGKLAGADRDADFAKLKARELTRLGASLDEAEKLQGEEKLPVHVYLHFPPATTDFVFEEEISLMKDRGVDRCFFGHVHGRYDLPQTDGTHGIPLTLISADFLDFIPLLTKI